MWLDPRPLRHLLRWPSPLGMRWVAIFMAAEGYGLALLDLFTADLGVTWRSTVFALILGVAATVLYFRLRTLEASAKGGNNAS